MCYTAGPYTDRRGSRYVELNIRAAEEVALKLWGWDYSVICPHTNTRHFDGAHGYEVWLKGDFEQVRRCDFIVVLPRWETSSGTKREIEKAKEEGIPVFYWEKDADVNALYDHSHGIVEKQFKV